MNMAGFIGNIDPKTYLQGISAIYCGEPKIQCVVTCFIKLGEIAFHSQGIIAIANLTCGRINNRKISALVLAMIPIVSVGILNISVRSFGAILTIVGIDRPTCEILILEIINNVRALTNAKRNGNNQTIAVMKSCCQSALKVCGGFIFGNSFKSEGFAIEYSDIAVIKAQSDIALFEDNFMKSVVNGSNNSQLSCFAKGNNDSALSECNLFGNNYLNGGFTYNLTAIYQLSGGCANLAVGNKQAVFYSSHRRIGKLPNCISRDFSLCSNKVGSNGCKLNGRTGGVVFIFCLDCGADKFSCGRSCGDNQNTMSSLTLCTIGRRTVDCELFAGALRKEA